MSSAPPPNVPPFTALSAQAKVKTAQKLWNTKDPECVVKAYTEDSVWRNRDQFMKGQEEIKSFLERKWAHEKRYRLRKELFAFTDNKIAVQFWYEYQADESNPDAWRRCYGLEDWTFAQDGRMKKRQMSGNEIQITDAQRWFKDGMTDEQVDALVLGDEHH